MHELRRTQMGLAMQPRATRQLELRQIGLVWALSLASLLFRGILRFFPLSFLPLFFPFFCCPPSIP